MWKKFLAVMAITAVFFSASASALGLPVGPGTPIPSYIDNFAVTPATFNPQLGTTAMSFDLAYTSDVYAYVMNDEYEIVALLADHVATQPATGITYTWHGRAGNTATGELLSTGTYLARAFAYVNGEMKDNDYQYVTISYVNPDSPDVSALAANPTTFSAQNGQSTQVSFNVNKDAYLDVVVKQGDTVIRTFDDYSGNDWYRSVATHSISWDGKNNAGATVANGNYTVSVTAVNPNGTDTETTTVAVSATGTVTSGVIQDFELDPNTTWDPTDEDLEINFELASDVDSLMIEAKKGMTVVEILDDVNVDDGDYEEYWDGTDDDGDYVNEGVWQIVIRADGNTATQTVVVEYEQADIADAFVTKREFDPSEDEFTNLVFKVDAGALVTVDVYNNNRKEFTLLDEEPVRKNRWYSVMWDGVDEDGDEVTYGNNWEFRIRAENPTEDDVFTTAVVEIDVAEDEVSTTKANVTNDYTAPIVFDEDNDNVMEISYCIDQDADVFLAVYKGSSASGRAEVELLDYLEQDADCYVVSWDGEDEDGRELSDGIYSYKLISKVGSRKDTETGKFVIGNAGDLGGGGEQPPYVPPYVPPIEPPYVPPVSAGEYYWDLAYLAPENELSQAIVWATEEGIFNGYPDGSFKPYQNINRAEVLKVILEAFDVNLMPMTGSNEGYSDVDPYAWYMPYVRTATVYGMMNGYGDGTARLTNNINRVELLKLALETSSTFTGYELVTPNYGNEAYADVDFFDPDASWFSQYVFAASLYDLLDTYFLGGNEYLRPAQLVERGEVVLLLHRMSQAGLL